MILELNTIAIESVKYKFDFIYLWNKHLILF